MDIPKFRYPFNNEFPTTLTFGSVPTDEEIKKKFTEWGWTGHPGIDFACPEDTEIVAIDSGEIIQSGGNGDYGETITIQHSWGTSFYAHLSICISKVGDKVNASQPIGKSGSTGSAFGPHLHFAIKPIDADLNNGYQGYIDPSQYFTSSESTVQTPETKPPEPMIVEKVVEKIVEKPVEVIKEVIKEVPVEKIVEKEVIKEVIKEVPTDINKLLIKANEARKQNRQDNLNHILELASDHSVTNDQIRDLLHVSQSTASEYLSELEAQGKLKSTGKAKATEYQKT